MSAFATTTGIRTALRQFAVAATLCAAVAAPAAFVAHQPDGTSVSVATGEDNNWPTAPKPAPLAPLS